MNFFDIQSVCIIWASEHPEKIGNDLLRNVSWFSGKVFGVNPKWGVYESKKFYTDIVSLPNVPDVAVFAIPARFVAKSLEECGEKWIKRIIIISAGFKEVGNVEGETELIDIAKKYDMKILGPNCLWYIDTCSDLNLSFGGKEIKKWNIAMVSQSWAMAVAFTDWAYEYGVGFSKIISMGNKADLCENDFLEELIHDKKTQVIALYLESIECGTQFCEIVKRLSKKKPIVIVKSGMSARGTLAAASHTGALSSCADILKSAFIQSGLHYTDKLEEFFLWGQAFSQTREINIPEEMVVVTNAGWPGVMITDHMEFHDIQIAEFSDNEKQVLMDGMPDAASVKNPIDIIGDATSVRYEKMLENIVSLKRNLAIYVLLTPQTTTDVYTVASKIIEFQTDHPDTLIFTSFMGGHSLENSREALEKHKVLHYNYPQKGIAAFSRLLEQKKWESLPEKKYPSSSFTNQKSLQKLVQQQKESGKHICETSVVQEIFETYEVPIIQEYIVNSIEELQEIFPQIALPMVAKISSSDIAHKTDIGAVILSIKTLADAETAYNAILENVQNFEPNATVEGVSVCSQIMKSREIFVGLKRDSSFGDILIVGMWGIYVNVYNDVQRKILPVNAADVEEMLEGLLMTPILHGVRWEQPVAMEKLVDTIMKITHIFQDIPEIREIDINPIQVNDSSATVVDAKLYL